MFTESSVVMYENVIIDFQKGTPASVEFDFMKIWEFKKLLKESFNSEKLHFYHVHPLGFGTSMSNVDENCLIGLNLAFNYPVNFSILTFRSENLFDFNRSLYICNEKHKTFCELFASGFLGRMLLCILKNLSEGE